MNSDAAAAPATPLPSLGPSTLLCLGLKVAQCAHVGKDEVM